MADETDEGKTEPTPRSRRAVVTSAAQAAITAPAVTLLLSASTKNVFAQFCTYTICVDPVPSQDDFTFGNNAEDIDAVQLGSNFNPFNGQPSQDDQI
jgi:hypothetical protein